MKVQLPLGSVQFIKFSLIGVVNTLLHGGILIASVELLRVSPTLSNLYAFIIANVFSYIANSKFTFSAALSFSLYLRFFVASLFSLGLTLIISYSVEYFDLHYLFGFGLIVVFVPVINFVVVKYLAFAHLRHPQ